MAATRSQTALRPVHVALFDANTLIAKGVKQQLSARAFPIASMQLYTSRDDPDSNLTEFAGEPMLVTAPDIESLGRLEVAFLCGTPEEGSLYADWPRRAGFVAIDLTTACNVASQVPVVNAAVNLDAIPAGPGMIAIPHPISLFLSSLLAPVRLRCGLQSATAVVFQPASEGGETGIEELYRQTIGLLNFQDFPQDVFRHQLAFNLIPSFLYGPTEIPGGSRPSDLEWEVQKVTGDRFDLAVEVLLAPIFHCHAAVVRLVLPAGVGQDRLMAALAQSDEIQIRADGEPTPVGRAGKPGVAVAGVRPAGRESEFWVWAVTDNLQTGSAANAVRVAEALVRRGLGLGER